MLDKTGLEFLVSVQTTIIRGFGQSGSPVAFSQIERDCERNREDWNSANKTLTEFNEYFWGKTKSQINKLS